MQTTKWYLSTTHRLLDGGPHYNAVKVVDGKTKECDEPPTKHRYSGEGGVKTLNNQESRATVVVGEVKK